MQNNYFIKKATNNELNFIYNLAGKIQIDKLPTQDIEHTGFLVSAFTKNDYLKFLQKAEHFYLCMDENRLCGFILAYTDKQIETDEWVNNLIKQKENENFVLIKQIVVDKKYKGKGVAQKLYAHLFNKMQENICYAVIVLEPLNIRSIKFHEKLGFKKVFEATPPDSLKRGVWKKELKKQNDATNKLE